MARQHVGEGDLPLVMEPAARGGVIGRLGGGV